MPRRLLRDGLIVEDDWLYAAEAGGSAAAALILTFSQWQNERDAWMARGGRLGVVLMPADRVERLAADLPLLSLIACSFSGPSEGRGYSQARSLRERWKFAGELRATGYVRRDQLFFMARCGFNSFELPDTDLDDAHLALADFSRAYQPSNDTGLAFKLPLRRRDTPASA
jgi:uncharacterized protein (DUF934 family)